VSAVLVTGATVTQNSLFSSLAMAIAIASTHLTGHRGMARLSLLHKIVGVVVVVVVVAMAAMAVT